LPGVRRIRQDFLEVRPTTWDHVAADAQSQDRSVDLIVIRVTVRRFVIEDDDQVKIAVGPGAVLGATTEEVDPEGLQRFRQPTDDALKGFLL
jgi:hypothetical protein